MKSIKRSIVAFVVLFAIFCATSVFATYNYYPVYKTDSAGDVYFKYPSDAGLFLGFYCDKYIPETVWGEAGDPNLWDWWKLTDYLPERGHKLLVPRRIRWWFWFQYLYNISDHLYVVTYTP